MKLSYNEYFRKRRAYRMEHYFPRRAAVVAFRHKPYQSMDVKKYIDQINSRKEDKEGKEYA